MVFCEMFFIGILVVFIFFEVWFFRRFCLFRGFILKSEYFYWVFGGYYVVRYYFDENMYYWIVKRSVWFRVLKFIRLRGFY